VLRGFKEVSWKTAKGMMSETNFLNSLTTLDVDGINSGQVSNTLTSGVNMSHVYTGKTSGGFPKEDGH